MLLLTISLLIATLGMVKSQQMSFFLTSVGPGQGGNLGGLNGADAHCTKLAEAVGQSSGRTWKAYLSTSTVDARDRIGTGPWYNQKLVKIADNVNQLHSNNGGNTQLGKQGSLDEKGVPVNGRGDSPNKHDILTGTLANGRKHSNTCNNWRSSSSDMRARVGHHDKQGGGAAPMSWNSAHDSRGCSLADLRRSGGDGLYYCFAIPTPATTTRPPPTTTTPRPTPRPQTQPAPTPRAATTRARPLPTTAPQPTVCGDLTVSGCAGCANNAACSWCPSLGICTKRSVGCGNADAPILSAALCPQSAECSSKPNCQSCTATGAPSANQQGSKCKWCPPMGNKCIGFTESCGGSIRSPLACSAPTPPPPTPPGFVPVTFAQTEPKSQQTTLPVWLQEKIFESRNQISSASMIQGSFVVTLIGAIGLLC